MADVRQNPWPKRIGLTLLTLAGLVVVLLVGLLLWIGSDRGRDFVKATVEELSFAGQTVEIDGLNGSVLGQFEIDQIELTGRDGVWLIARDVVIDWSPRDLFSKQVTLKALRVGDLDILARPILTPGTSDGDPAITDFDIDGIVLPDIFIAEPVLGRDITLSAQGRLDHGPDGGATVLSALSEQGDTLTADLAWSRSLVISGTADVVGEPGGLIARLLQLDADQGLSAEITTDNDVTLIDASINGADVASFEVTRRQSQVGIEGRIEPSQFPFLAQMTPYLGGTTQIDALLPRDEGAGALLSLKAPKLILDAAGRQSGDIIILDQFAIEATDPLDTTVSIGSLSATGEAVLGEVMSFKGQVNARAVEYGDYLIDRLSGAATLSFVDGRIDFDTRLLGAASQTLAQTADGAMLDLAGDYELASQNLNLSRGNIRLPGLSFTGRGKVGFGDTPTAEVTGRYDIDSAIFRDSPKARLRGEATIRQSGRMPIINVTGRATSISGLADAIQPLTDEGVDYRARLRFEDGLVRVPQLQFGNPQFTASGTASWTDGRVQAALDYQADDYRFAALDAKTIQGKVALSGPPSAIDFDTDLRVQSLNTGGLAMANAAINLAGQYASGQMTAAGEIEADSEQGPVKATGDIAFNDGDWTVTSLDGSLGDLVSQGTISGVGGDINALRADLTLSGSTPFIPAETIEGRILVGDARVNIDTTLTTMSLGRVDIESANIRAAGPRDAVNFTVEAVGQTVVNDLDRALDLSASGLADLTADTVTATSDFNLEVGSQAIIGTASVSQMADGWGAAVDAGGLGGTFQAALTPGPEGGLRFDLDKLSVPAVARMIGRPATEGQLSGSGQFAFVGETIEGQSEFLLDNLRSPISQAEPISVRLQADLASEILTATLEATEGGLSGQARITGPVQTYARAPYLEWPPETPLQGQADLQGQVGPLVEVFLPPRTDVAGRIDSDIRFTVPLNRTGLVGDVSITDGVFEQGAIGLRLEDISLVAELQGETIRVPTLSANGSKGGTLSGSGQMGIGESTGTVDIQANKLRVIDRGEGMAEVSGELSLSRTAELLRLAGELRVTDADIDIGRLPKPGLPTLDVNFGDVDDDTEEPRRFASSRTELDINVLSNGRINVTGRGLDALMGLDASIVGSFDNPVVTGEMTIARGRFDFLGKRFEFRDSSVLLRDDILQSILAFEAVRQTSDLRAVVQVTGTIERPEIELTAEPTLPEDEVLSRVLFGRSPTQLSAIETARLAAALTQLSGGSGFDLFGSLENAVGLDTLEIGQNETGQAQLTTGKYLSDDVYLEVRTAAEGTPGIAVEWQVRDNISLEAETQADERQRLSVQWKKDFD